MITNVIFAIFSGTLAYLFTKLLVEKIRNYQIADNLPVTEVSLEQRPIPDDAIPLVIECRQLGFNPLGVVDYESRGSIKSVTNWIYVDTTRTAVIELVVIKSANPILRLISIPRNGVGLLIHTTFPDFAMVETAHPNGTLIRTPNYRFRRVKASLSAALISHQRDVAEFAAKHGPPIQIQSMQDYLGREQEFQKRYGKRRHRPAVVMGFIQSIVFLWLTLSLIFLTVGINQEPINSIMFCGQIIGFGVLILASWHAIAL